MRVPTPDVIAAAQAADRKWGVFASVSLAQFALESAWGSRATGRFNFFGIKASAAQPGIVCHTHEEEHGALVPRECRFRSFGSVDEAFDEHARLIATDHRYAAAMAHKGDLNAFVHFMAPVYATDPRYEPKVLDMIESEGFRKYDPVIAKA